MTLPRDKKCEDCPTLISRGYLRCNPCFDAFSATRRFAAMAAQPDRTDPIYTSNVYEEPS